MRAVLSVTIVGISLILALGLQARFLTNYTNFILLLAASAMNGTDLSWIVGLVTTVPLYYLLAVRQRARRPAAVPEPARN
ncbi:MAG TPA: hypothetical protein VFW50_18285 [Streptosporangiaceae bacterium]|nr:hypothetical protein [Streptosporangiaceae bacterium]